jgi:hypothetical protein
VLRVSDIGLGGLALQGPVDRAVFSVDRIIEGCELQTSSGRSVLVALRVRHIEALVGARDAERIGCEFVGMTPAIRNGLQHLIGSVALPAESPEMRRTE